jgi:hypothetical protein
VASRHGFAIARLDARLSFENAEKESPGGRVLEGREGRGVVDLRRAFAFSDIYMS